MSLIPSKWYSRAFSQTVASFTRVHLLRTGIALGLFESLREPKTGNQLVQESQLAPDLLQAWLRAAETQGLIRVTRERDRAYVVAGLARWLLETPRSKSLVAVLDQLVENYGPLHERMPELLRGIERPDYGTDVDAGRAAEASRLIERSALEALARIPGVRGAKRVLDIGCGHGTYLTGLLLRYRDAHGLGIEQNEDVAEIAVRNLAEADLVRRSEVRVGEFMAFDLEAGSFDLILLNNNLYYFAPATWGALLERIFSRLVPRGLLAIQVPVVSDRAGSRIMGHTANTAAFDLYLRAHNNLYGLPDLALLHTVLRETGFETVAETSFLPGGAARYLWARAPANEN